MKNKKEKSKDVREDLANDPRFQFNWMDPDPIEERLISAFGVGRGQISRKLSVLRRLQADFKRAFIYYWNTGELMHLEFGMERHRYSLSELRDIIHSTGVGYALAGLEAIVYGHEIYASLNRLKEKDELDDVEWFLSQIDWMLPPYERPDIFFAHFNVIICGSSNPAPEEFHPVN